MTDIRYYTDEASVQDMPVDWRMTPLCELASVKYGKARPAEHGNIPVVGSSGVFAWTSKPLVDFPTIVIGRKGSAGEVYYLDKPFWPSDTAFYLEWKTQVEPQFIAARLTIDKLSGKHAQTTLPSLQRQDVEDKVIPLPPLPEQRRIAAVLNTIQDAIAAQEDVIAAARAFKRSLMQRLFTYGPGREPAPTKETEIGEIPAHWEVVTIGDVAEISSGTTPSRINQAYWSDGTVPWVKTGEVDYCCIQATEERVTPLALQETSLRLYPSGTLLLAMYGQGVTRGKVAVLGIEATINQACAAIRITTSDVQQGYLYHYLVSSYERLRSFSHGTQQLNLNSRLIRDFGVPLPPTSEQSQISASLSAADAKIAAEEDRKTALESLFKSMLHQLMTGRMRLLADEGLPLGASGVAGGGTTSEQTWFLPETRFVGG